MIETWCWWDRCHSWVPETHNARYCKECRCKRKSEAAVKRGEVVVTAQAEDEVLWQLAENRKLANAERALAKNQWLLSTKSFAMFDLETYDLAADFGLIMVGCIKTRGDDGPIWTATTRTGDPATMDRESIVAIRDKLEKYDYVVTYNGTRFDIPYLNTRLLVHDERPLAFIRHIDLYYTVRYNLRLQRSKLVSVELALLDSTEKTQILPGIWARALQGSQDDMDYIVEHCQGDVKVLEAAFDKLCGFVNFSQVRVRKYGGSGYGGIA